MSSVCCCLLNKSYMARRRMSQWRDEVADSGSCRDRAVFFSYCCSLWSTKTKGDIRYLVAKCKEIGNIKRSSKKTCDWTCIIAEGIVLRWSSKSETTPKSSFTGCCQGLNAANLPLRHPRKKPELTEQHGWARLVCNNLFQGPCGLEDNTSVSCA